MRNHYGTCFQLTIFGQSHGAAIGVTMEGLPAGKAIDEAKLQEFLNRSAPGQADTSPRREPDCVEILSGLLNGRTCGAPVTAIIRNIDAHAGDYAAYAHIPRPGHADYAVMEKYGTAADLRGGGVFSGRLTAPLCIAGGICLQLLEEMGIAIHASLRQVGAVCKPEAFSAAIREAKARGDSLGGIIQCTIDGLPAGIGAPMFGGLENRISQAVFAIPGVKGIEFGSGFAGAAAYGSENNDGFYLEDGRVVTRTNAHGGILGGLSSGMPVVFRVACKPTPSIAMEQDSVDLSKGTNVRLSVSGRHDPCFAVRAVPCVEAAAAVAIYDAILEERVWNSRI